MKLLRHILRDYTNIQLFCGSVLLRCRYGNAVFSVDDLYVIGNFFNTVYFDWFHSLFQLWISMVEAITYYDTILDVFAVYIIVFP